MTLKITFVLTDRINSFSESFYSNGESVADLNQNQIKNYINARMLISGVQTTMEYVRVSVVGQARRVRVFLPANFPPDTNGAGRAPNALNAGQATESDAAFTAILVRKNSATSFSRFYMRGIPDYLVVRGGQFVKDAVFAENFTNYADTIVNNAWGWYGVAGGGVVKAGITGMVQNNDGHVTFTMSENFFPEDFANKKYSVRVSGQAQPRNINGPLVVFATSRTVARSLRPIAINTFVAGNGVMSRSNLGLVQILSLVMERVVRRGAGRPFGLSAGRQRAQVRG